MGIRTNATLDKIQPDKSHLFKIQFDKSHEQKFMWFLEAFDAGLINKLFIMFYNLFYK